MKNFVFISLLLVSSQLAAVCWVDGVDNSGRIAEQMEADFKGALINSEEALKEHWSIALSRISESLPSADAEHFLSSLSFNENGLTSYRFDVFLENKASYADAYSILALFGAQSTAGAIRGLKVESELDRSIDECGGGGWSNYRCVRRGQCSPISDSICTYNC